MESHDKYVEKIISQETRKVGEVIRGWRPSQLRSEISSSEKRFIDVDMARTTSRIINLSGVKLKVHRKRYETKEQPKCFINVIVTVW